MIAGGVVSIQNLDCWCADNLAVFHKHVQRIFKEQQGSSSAAPTAVLGGADGKQLFQSREEVVKCFA